MTRLQELDEYGTKGPTVVGGFLLEPLEWHKDAACVEADPEIFFPERGQSPREARSYCARCPVVAECLSYALENDEKGIWGNTSERERRVLSRRDRPSVG